eukprot:TRINITY_DN17770_c0_g1_i1.p1 TRINITY_DN17770_c0_g1~~TRINITY_DN17770_c0_g1_i1.p1  ORF type:complete len:466 (+),score=121.04 TRINITY_DN17770_c0_g1_i1:54-1451(+)
MRRSATAVLAVACVAVGAARLTGRPEPSKRAFVSPVVDEVVANISGRMKDAELATLFTNCMPNTLDTTVQHAGRNDSFIITGDITAMWLRDSSGQVTPYIKYLNQDPGLKAMLLGVLERQFSSLLLDVYANAYNYGKTGGDWQHDKRIPNMTKGVWEGKYELDSWAYVMENAYKVYNETGYGEVSAKYKPAMLKIYASMRYMQQDSRNMAQTDTLYYSFARTTEKPSDTLLNAVGPPGLQCGLIRSAFRPSDDATWLPYLVPSNAFAVVALRHTAEIFEKALGDATNAAKFSTLADEVAAAITKHAIVPSPTDPSQKIYAYEVDCGGSHVIMDDANVPNLVSLPYLGFVSADDPVYQATRTVAFSLANPYYSRGARSSGVGSPHTGQLKIWPLSHIFKGLTSDSSDEVADCLAALKYAANGTGFMHESYDVDSPGSFTRPWFAWANSMFGNLILQVAGRFPALIF